MGESMIRMAEEGAALFFEGLAQYVTCIAMATAQVKGECATEQEELLFHSGLSAITEHLTMAIKGLSRVNGLSNTLFRFAQYGKGGKTLFERDLEISQEVSRELPKLSEAREKLVEALTLLQQAILNEGGMS